MVELNIADKLRRIIPWCGVEVSVHRGGHVFLKVNEKRFREVIAFLKNEGFSHLAGITALETESSFELLYHLTMEGILLSVRVNLPLKNPTVHTITDIFPAALLYEREAHDLYGINFEGHPDLKLLILPDNWPNNVYPMRKSEQQKEEKPTK